MKKSRQLPRSQKQKKKKKRKKKKKEKERKKKKREIIDIRNKWAIFVALKI